MLGIAAIAVRESHKVTIRVVNATSDVVVGARILAANRQWRVPRLEPDGSVVMRVVPAEFAGIWIDCPLAQKGSVTEEIDAYYLLERKRSYLVRIDESPDGVAIGVEWRMQGY
jgi:hypothetical protein